MLVLSKVRNPLNFDFFVLRPLIKKYIMKIRNKNYGTNVIGTLGKQYIL